MIGTIAAYEAKGLVRRGTVRASVAIMLTMTVLAGVIGWSSHATIARVYDEATRYLADQGQAAPPNPFLLKPTLDLLATMEIYVPLIGALLALVVGHVALADETTDGVGRLMFSRPVTRRAYVAGKLLAVSGVLAAILAVCAVLSVVEASLVNRAVVSAGDVGRVLAFYGLSWLYLLVFALVGMATVDAGGSRTIHFDSTGATDHFPVNKYSLYYTSTNAMDVTVEVSAQGAAPVTTTVAKDAGGAEVPD